MANPYKLPRIDLVPFLSNYIGRLTAYEVDGLTNGQCDALVAAISAVSADFESAVTDLGVAEAEYHAAVSEAEALQAEVLELIQSGKYLLKSAGCPGAAFAILGFNIPVVAPVVYVPSDPSDLSAFGYSNGVNELRFAGNNSGAVVYIVEARIGESAVFELVGTTKRQRYLHAGVVPGVQYVYRVFARASSGDSGYSGTASVYSPV